MEMNLVTILKFLVLLLMRFGTWLTLCDSCRLIILIDPSLVFGDKAILFLVP